MVDKLAEKIQGRADVNIGKRGLTEEVLREIQRRLDKEGVIKVRLNRNLAQSSRLTARDVASLLSERLDAAVADVRGRTIVLAKREKRL